MKILDKKDSKMMVETFIKHYKTMKWCVFSKKNHRKNRVFFNRYRQVKGVIRNFVKYLLSEKMV